MREVESERELVYFLESLAFLAAGFADWVFFLLPLTAAWAFVLLSVLIFGGRLYRMGGISS